MSFTDQVPVAMAVMEDKITTSLVTFYLQPFGVSSENCVIFGHFDPFVAGLAFVAGYLLGINGITISINGIIIGRSSSRPNFMDQISETISSGIDQFRENLENMSLGVLNTTNIYNVTDYP